MKNTADKLMDKVVQDLRANTLSNEQLKLIAEAVEFAIASQYCEFENLANLYKDFTCPFCGRIHLLEECNSEATEALEEFKRLGPEEFDKKYKPQ